MSDGGGNCRGPCPRVQLYQAIVFAAPVLFAFMLLLLFCLLYLKRRRGANIHSPMRGQFFAVGLLATPPLEHGLSKSFRQRLPITPFGDNFSSMCQETQCAVCLGDYQVGEKIQQLPACNHSFHVQCIDEWLAKNVTCPICRTSVLVDEVGIHLVGEAQCEVGVSGREVLTSGDGHRLWEGRVISQVQDQSSGDTPAVEVGGGRSAGEPAANMERS